MGLFSCVQVITQACIFWHSIHTSVIVNVIK